ncbi:MAG TPA: DUF4189 domain-containing protein [Syntrophobacteraceae bacterium]|nr:DUF4189 domain-containing protein [Syntrophobacteraceae bacterium]
MKKSAFLLVVPALVFLFAKDALCVGAIAVDDEIGESEPGYGFVTGAFSREEAKRRALDECGRSGNEDCRVVLWFESCGAYAASLTHYGVGWGSTKEQAKKRALDECGPGCVVKVAECE